MIKISDYERRVYSVLKEKGNFGGDFNQIVRNSPWKDMQAFCDGLRKDDYVGKLALYGMNHGFESGVKGCLADLWDVYKTAYTKNVRQTDVEHKYKALREKIKKEHVLKPQFLCKDILFDHIDSAIAKTQALSDESLEMFVPGLDERMSESRQAFLALKDTLNGVLDWSSESALLRAKEIFQKIRIWNNVKIVAYVTSTQFMDGAEILKPIKEAEKLALDWANATVGVGKNNPRVKESALKALDFQDDQLKVWTEIHKKRKNK